MKLSFSDLFIPLNLLACASVAYGTQCTNKVTGFQTIDVFTNVVKDLVPQTGKNTPIYLTDFATCKLNIIAKTTSTPSNCNEGKIKCVKLELGSYSRKEKVAPFTLYGDSAPDYEEQRPEPGIQKLKACPYQNAACTTGKGTCFEMMVDVQNGDANGPFVPSFVLYDASKGLSSGRIDYVNDGAQMCLPKSKQVNMKANLGCYVDQVEFTVTDDENYDIEDMTVNYDAPFWIYGHSELEPGAGTYELFGRSGFQLNREYTISAIPNGDASKEILRTLTFNKVCT